MLENRRCYSMVLTQITCFLTFFSWRIQIKNRCNNYVSLWLLNSPLAEPDCPWAYFTTRNSSFVTVLVAIVNVINVVTRDRAAIWFGDYVTPLQYYIVTLCPTVTLLAYVPMDLAPLLVHSCYKIAWTWCAVQSSRPCPCTYSIKRGFYIVTILWHHLSRVYVTRSKAMIIDLKIRAFSLVDLQIRYCYFVAQQYDSVLHTLINLHAPLVSKKISPKPP